MPAPPPTSPVRSRFRSRGFTSRKCKRLTLFTRLCQTARLALVCVPSDDVERQVILRHKHTLAVWALCLFLVGRCAHVRSNRSFIHRDSALRAKSKPKTNLIIQN